MNEEAGAQFVDEVLGRQATSGESLPKARRSHSSELIDSMQYFARSNAWKPLRPLRKNWQEVVAQLCAAKEARPGTGSATGATASAGETVTKSLTERVRDWVGSDEFTEAKNILWRSYYANALVPELRPHDRPEMLDWIRILAALERLRPSLDGDDWRYDRRGCSCAERLSRARVSMPHELFAEVPAPDPVPEMPKNPVEAEIARLRAVLERLYRARRGLDSFYQRKISKVRLEPPPGPDRNVDDGEPTCDEQDREMVGATGQQPGMEVRASAVSRSAALQGPPPPWLLTQEDAEELRDVDAELERLGVPLAGSLVSRVAAALDDAIAADTALLSALESRIEVLGVGALAVARHTVRGLRPAWAAEVPREEQAERAGDAG